MKVHLLCPGPSLAKYDDDGFAGVTIGVNNAVASFRVDWWAALDFEVLAGVCPVRIYRGVFTHTEVVDRTDSRRLAQMTPGLVTTEMVASHFHRIKNWNRFTAPASLLLAAYLGATSIDVFGADMRGEADFTGHAGGYRTEDRWRDERAIFDQIDAYLSGNGIKITRHI